MTQHQESKTFLHGVRDMRTWKELLINDFDYFHKVKTRSLKSVEEMTNSFENMTWQEEGYVALDLVSMERGKLKNPAYVSAHHISSGMSPYHIIEVIKKNELSEYLCYFHSRTEELNGLQESYNKLIVDLESIYANNLLIFKNKTDKEYAENVFKICKSLDLNNFSGLFFLLRKNKSTIREYINNIKDSELYRILKKK